MAEDGGHGWRQALVLVALAAITPACDWMQKKDPPNAKSENELPSRARSACCDGLRVGSHLCPAQGAMRSTRRSGSGIDDRAARRRCRRFGGADGGAGGEVARRGAQRHRLHRPFRPRASARGGQCVRRRAQACGRCRICGAGGGRRQRPRLSDGPAPNRSSTASPRSAGFARPHVRVAQAPAEPPPPSTPPQAPAIPPAAPPSSPPPRQGDAADTRAGHHARRGRASIAATRDPDRNHGLRRPVARRQRPRAWPRSITQPMADADAIDSATPSPQPRSLPRAPANAAAPKPASRPPTRAGRRIRRIARGE